jgi:tetratricopeptide (TPR) repeat protein
LTKAIHGAESLQAFKIMDTIGNSLMREGHSPEALEYSLPATQGVERLMGPEHYETGFVYFNLAAVYRGLRRTQDMIDCYDKALKILDRYPDNLGTVRLRWTYATDVFRRRGKLDEAEACLRHAVELAVKAQGADHPETLQTQRALAGVLFDKGQTEEAKRILVQAIDTCRAVRRWASPTEFALSTSLMVVLRGRKEYDEAAERLTATLERFEKARGRADRMVLLLMVTKSAVEKDRDHREAAAVILEDAAQRLVDDGKGDDPRVKQWRGEAVVVRQGS